MDEHPKRRRPEPERGGLLGAGKAGPDRPAGGPSARAPRRKQTEAILRENEDSFRRLFDLTEDLQEEIRQRRDAEEAARREQAFRETIENSLIAGLVAVDTEGRILSVNDAF
jgi:PAS domain-containing protein